ncbi:hypothetical protein B0H12DRAFT_1081369 [Mycena haematopus]|nr:hypothetical protein B0H12DRAFT_1081369 [Mycena haematopus]
MESLPSLSAPATLAQANLARDAAQALLPTALNTPYQDAARTAADLADAAADAARLAADASASPLIAAIFATGLTTPTTLYWVYVAFGAAITISRKKSVAAGFTMSTNASAGETLTAGLYNWNIQVLYATHNTNSTLQSTCGFGVLIQYRLWQFGLSSCTRKRPERQESGFYNDMVVVEGFGEILHKSDLVSSPSSVQILFANSLIWVSVDQSPNLALKPWSDDQVGSELIGAQLSLGRITKIEPHLNGIIPAKLYSFVQPLWDSANCRPTAREYWLMPRMVEHLFADTPFGFVWLRDFTRSVTQPYPSGPRYVVPLLTDCPDMTSALSEDGWPNARLITGVPHLESWRPCWRTTGRSRLTSSSWPPPIGAVPKVRQHSRMQRPTVCATLFTLYPYIDRILGSLHPPVAGPSHPPASPPPVAGPSRPPPSPPPAAGPSCPPLSPAPAVCQHPACPPCPATTMQALQLATPHWKLNVTYPVRSLPPKAGVSQAPATTRASCLMT